MVEELTGESEQEKLERIQEVIDLSLSKIAIIINGWDGKDDVNPSLFYQCDREQKIIKTQYKLIRVLEDNLNYEENK